MRWTSSFSANEILERAAWGSEWLGSKTAELMRQSRVGFDMHGGIVLFLKTETAAEEARADSDVAALSNKLRTGGLAPGLHCVVEGKDAAELPSPDPTTALVEAQIRPEVVIMSTLFARWPLPHTKPKSSAFSREIEAVEVTIWSSPKHGIPYGAQGRLLVMEIATEALARRNRIFGAARVDEIVRRVDSGATKGSGPERRQGGDQLERFCRTFIHTEDRKEKGLTNVVLVGDLDLSRSPRPEFILDESFWRLLQLGAVALDRRIVERLCPSPLAIDLYAWMSYTIPQW